jgi:hypothetical protein
MVLASDAAEGPAAVTRDMAVEREFLRALGLLAPATVSELVAELRAALAGEGLAPAEKVDRVWVGRVLTSWSRQEPPLAFNDFAAEDVDDHGRVAEGAERLWFSTDAADAREAELTRALDGRA